MGNRVCLPLKLKPHGYPGVLVTFCGVDGSGKSSLIGGLERMCREAGLNCLRTFTPTRRIREDSVFRALVEDPCNTSSIGSSSYHSARRINVLGILLSIMGDLIQHTTDTIVPALQLGDVVLCDRYVFTSQAEIGARSDLRETEPVLAAIAEHVLRPDLAFGLNVSDETSQRRVRARNNANDQPPPMTFLTRQVTAYRAVFEANGLVVLDTERDRDETLRVAGEHFARVAPLARQGLAGQSETAAPHAGDGHPATPACGSFSHRGADRSTRAAPHERMQPTPL
jgi:dTMP kinase